MCFTVLFTYILFGQIPSSKALNATLLVFVGFIIGSFGEQRFTWAGLSDGLISSLFVSLYGIFAKQLLGELGQW